MSKDIGVEISGIRGVQLRFERFPEAAREHLKEQFSEIIKRLLGQIEARTPTKTGSLRSHEKTAVSEGRNYVKANFFLTGDWAKAGSLEYGAKKPNWVRSHTMRYEHAWANRLAAPKTVIVKRFKRTPDIAVHRFIRGPAEEIHDETIAAIMEALKQADQETQNAN